MSLALYRKYRPGTFAEVKGQEHVTEPLRQALRTGRIHHAYLFSGPRGCGKTSSARILARSLNCEKGPTPDPCGVCDSCVALGPTGPGHLDVIEIDAASHGGVDDARDLRERAFFAPISARFKIYIIDEAHMVTREGFNALLKLVEEPPPHLKFVFATTEPEKVIGTIKSRTHHYPFRLMPPSTLRQLMEDILASEAVPYEPTALPLVVRAGAGSARDTLSILDQLLAGADEAGITYSRAVSLLGYTDGDLLDEVVDAFARRDGALVFQTIDRVVEGGHDPRRFAMDLLERFRDLVVLANVPEAAGNGLLERPTDELERLQEQVASMGPAELTRAAELLNAGLTEMRGATSPRLLLELICARVLLPAVDQSEASLLARLERLERGMVAAAPIASSAITQPPPAPAQPTNTPQPTHMSQPTNIHQPANTPQTTNTQPTNTPQAPAGAQGPGYQTSGSGSGVSSVAGAGEGTGLVAASPPVRPDSADRSGARPSESSASPLAQPGAAHQVWPRVLEAVKQRQRVTWSILSAEGQLLGIEGNVATLGFDKPGTMKGFLAGKRDEIVAAALSDVLGGHWRVEAVVGNSGPGPSGGIRALPGPGGASAASGGSGGTGPRAEAPQAPQASRPAPARPPAPSAAERRPQPSAQPAPGPTDDSWPDAPPPDDFESPRPSAGQGLAAARSAAKAAAQAGPRAAQAGSKQSGAAAWPDSIPNRPAEADEVDPENDADAEGGGLAGIAVIQRELGGQVIGEIDHT